MYKIPLCIIAVAGLSSPLLAQSDGDNDADTSCEAQSRDCDDGDRAGQSAKAEVRGWNPERSAASDGNYIDPDDDGDGIPDAAARGGPKQTGKELKGIPARDGGPDTLPQDSDGDGLGDAASQSAGDPIPDVDITLDQNTTPSKPK